MNGKDAHDRIKVLEAEAKHLRRLVLFQQAQVQALRAYTVSKLAALAREKPEKAFGEIQQLTRVVYDRHIDKIERQSPAMAAALDLRAEMSRQEQELWYLASEQFRTKNGPDRGRSQGK